MKNVFLSIHQTLGVLSSPIHFRNHQRYAWSAAINSSAKQFSLAPSSSLSFILFFLFFFLLPLWGIHFAQMAWVNGIANQKRKKNIYQRIHTILLMVVNIQWIKRFCEKKNSIECAHVKNKKNTIYNNMNAIIHATSPILCYTSKSFHLYILNINHIRLYAIHHFTMNWTLKTGLLVLHPNSVL